MFRKIIDGEITDEDLDAVKYPHTEICHQYLEKYVVADYIAFYIATGYYHSALWESSFKQHFNSAADIFNISLEDKDMVIAKVKEILNIKYSLHIIEENPKLKLDKLWDEEA